MPRVLLLFEHPTLHGGERSLLALLPFLQAAGFQFEAIAPQSGELAAELAMLGIGVEATALSDPAGNKLSQEARREALHAAFTRRQPDLVHANSLAMSRLAGPVTARLEIPCLGHVRDIVSLSRQAVADVNCITRLLTVSSATRDWHLAQGVRGERMFVCYNGVDLERFCPRPSTGYLHDELRLSRDARLIGTIGQLVMRKGLEIALSAVREIAWRFQDVQWIVVGERCSQKQEAREYVQRLVEATACPPLCGRVHFLGIRRDVDRILNELTLLLHAARQEPLGRVLLEAAASGLPLVATDVGGTTEILPRSEFGDVLAPVGDSQALAAAADGLLADGSKRAQLARRLRQRACAAFGARAAADQLLAHYRAALAQKLS